ncbi:hypothetical protein S7711_04033 [Stachybotrys chartarum IBT 7711]|uniref:Phytocyanin domain-containing protein n=1 Tax=Stachybotrys chartarum (strain CBS 109288 / IBT 7711) TaxID=1280523 RepID=A0A084AXI9_STACB|nr:hypothetical protein S7711_04033 [Stachybotrys chartarum IBT 7711]
MSWLSIIWLLLFATTGTAQMTPSTSTEWVTQTVTAMPSPSSTPGSTLPMSATYTINVGAAGHRFTPETTFASIGDILEYRFYPAEHWVIRGHIDHPCIPFEYIGINRRGFSSGPQPVEAITDDAPRFRVRVNDTEPIYFYCGAPGSCVDHHMIGVVNPVSGMGIEEYRHNTEQVDFQLRPGEPWPTEGEENGPGSAPSSEDEPGEQDRSYELTPGVIAGITIGGAAVLILAVAVFFWVRQRRGTRSPRSFKGAAAGILGLSSTPTQGQEPMSSASTNAPWNPQFQATPTNTMPLFSSRSPPTSPLNTSPCAVHPGAGCQGPCPPSGPTTVTSPYYNHHIISQYNTTHQAYETPKPETQAVAELPTTPDSRNVSPPDRQSGGERPFSWSKEDVTFRRP